MTIITDEALEFAKEHISKYYDSDFYPKPVEFEAIWHSWEEVKNEIKSKNVQKHWVTPPRIMAAKKPKGGFRIVHQPEPIESLIYAALAYQVAQPIENARIPGQEKVACSYRLQPENGNYFAGGSGYPDFVEKTEELAQQYEFILVTDITDFYNQIYLHRLNNAIEHADSSLKPISDDIEWFITFLNSKCSQGIPVGPAASIVMAEAVLIDIDLFLRNNGVAHTRYVDDFRIFAASEKELRKVHEALTLYMYDNHRLTLSAEKTVITNATGYVQQQLHNQYAEERMQIFRSLEVFNPYSEELEEHEVEVEDEDELLKERAIAVINKVLELDAVDLGLTRSAIRKAKRHDISDLAGLLIENFSFFSPVINDVILYLDKITDDALATHWVNRFEQIVADDVLDSELVRYWVEWYLVRYQPYMQNPAIRSFIHSSPFFESKARAAITENNIAWVRSQKSNIFHLGNSERRALLNAARVLPQDERNHWLKMTIVSSPIQLDRWMAKWVLDTA